MKRETQIGEHMVENELCMLAVLSPGGSVACLSAIPGHRY